MEKKHKDFILKELIPFIRRNEGRNFGMEVWLDNWKPGMKFALDGVLRILPKDCGTAACIGGSIQALTCDHKDHEKHYHDVQEIGRKIGLDEDHADGLFMHWKLDEDEIDNTDGYGWPQKFRECFAQAKTPECKAEIACKLLELVVNTEGACLEPGYDEK